MAISYQQTALEMLSIARRWNRWREALVKTDHQLTELEELNLRGERVPEGLARSILDLSVEFNLNLPKRPPKDPTKALDLVFGIQVKLFRALRRQEEHRCWVARQMLRRRAMQPKA